MRVCCISAFELGSMKAHAINTIKMGSAFADLGHEVTFITYQSRDNVSPEHHIHDLYGLTTEIEWITLPRRRRSIYRKTEMWTFPILALPSVFSKKPDMIFARHYVAPLVTSRLGIPSILETHAYVGNKTAPFKLAMKATQHRAFRGLVTISNHLKAYYIQMGASAGKIQVLPTGVDTSLFQRPTDIGESPFASPAPNVTYMGHLYDFKGIPAILDAAAHLPNVYFHLIGGDPEDQQRHRKTIQQRNLSNVVMHGLMPQRELPPFLWHSQVLLLPPSANNPTAKWTSPVKLGEYLASGTPIVATAIPALRDLLTDDEVIFVEPDNGESLACGVQFVLDHADEAKSRTEAGLRKAQQLSYTNRAKQIISLI